MRQAMAGLGVALCVFAAHAQDQTIVITATRFPQDPRGLPAGTIELAPGQSWQGWWALRARAI